MKLKTHCHCEGAKRPRQSFFRLLRRCTPRNDMRGKIQNSRAGYTLIELLLVISIIGAIAFFSWQNLYQLGSEQELNNAILSVANLLRDAQQRSITQTDGKSWSVGFNINPVGRDGYYLFDGSQQLSLVTLKSVLEISQPPTPSSVNFHQISGELNSVNCPSVAFNEIIEVKIINSSQSRQLKIFCNGKIEF